MHRHRHRRATTRLARWSLFTCLALGVAAPATAHAWSKSHGPWPNRAVRYRINAASFGTRLNALSLSVAQARYWVRQTAEQWRWKSGADYFYSEDGTTTLGSRSDCDSSDDNFVAAASGCVLDDSGNPDCGTLAVTTTTYVTATGKPVSSHICVWGGAANWEVDGDAFAASEIDLASVLTHEWGHFLGLDHTADTVMNPTVDDGFRDMRYPTSDDIEGVRALYGQAANDLRMRKINGDDTVGTPWTHGTTPWSRFGATQAIFEGDGYVLKASPSPSGGSLHFTRAKTPLTSATAWANRSIAWTGGSYASPAMTFAKGAVVAAWPNKVATLDDCSGIRIVKTTDLFDSVVSNVNLPNDCTMGPVSLAFDPKSSRYVLVYQRYERGDALSDRMMARTSSDGVAWSAAVDLGVRTTHPPSISCRLFASDGCGIVYAHRGLNANLFTRAWTVASTTVELDSAWTSLMVRPFLPPSIGDRYNDAIVMWGDDDYSGVRLMFDKSAPYSQWDEAFIVPTGNDRINTPAVLGQPGSTTAYLMTVE